jgi:DNA-binding MarR family transcriptional regulator
LIWKNEAMTRAAEPQRDHVDRFLESIRDELPDLDLEVEGIVDRINGLGRRIKRVMEETLTERSLTWGEWRVLGLLRHTAPEYRRSPGYLAVHAELSSGAMTNRLDRLEEAGLIRRLPDPTDRRGIQVELTAAGIKAYDESTSAQAAKEALIASALTAKEKQELNNLLRRLMLVAEELDAEQGPEGSE